MKIKSHGHAHQRGFTLAELLVAIAIVALVMGGILTLLMSGNQSYLTGSNQAEAQAAARAALERMTVDLRESGYDPQGRACTASPGAAGCFNAISIPTQTSFIIQSDWNGAGPVAPASPIELGAPACINYSWAPVPSPAPCPAGPPGTIPRGEQITYTIDAVAQTLTRQEFAVDGAPQLLTTAVQRAAVGVNCAGVQIANPRFFQYCDVDGTDLGLAVPPGNEWQIRTVVVNMRVGVQNQPPAIWQAGAVTVTMSDRIRLRNRVP